LIKDSAHINADALEALGRREEAKALRERYGSRVLTTLSPHEALSRLTAHSIRKSQTNNAPFQVDF
jgi:hypothetical protein